MITAGIKSMAEDRMSFGKRGSGVAGSGPVRGTAARAPMSSGSMAGSASTYASPAAHGAPGLSADAEATLAGKPPHWTTVSRSQYLVAMLVCATVLFGFAGYYGPDLGRDLLHAGSYRESSSVRASDGDCSRINLVLTYCSASLTDIKAGTSRTVHFAMLFSSLDGEPMIGQRSSRDGDVLGLGSATSRMTNRMLTFLLFAGLVFAGLFSCLRKLISGRYKDGPAFQALAAEVQGVAQAIEARGTPALRTA